MDNHNLELLQSKLSGIASELFRFKQVFEKILEKIDNPMEFQRYQSQYMYFERKINKYFEEAGIRCISYNGHKYNEGMSVKAINIDEFQNPNELYVLQTIEPTVLINDRVYKDGVVILGFKGELI